MAADTQTTAPAGPPQLARLPSGEGLQQLLALQCGELCEQYSRFMQQGDAEALHDFRVAVRRLRSLLRSYRKLLDSDAQLTEQLRALQQQTNHARNLEVFVAQLQTHCPAQPQLLAPMQQQLARARHQLHRELPARWATLLPLLESPPRCNHIKKKHDTFGALGRRLGRRQLKRLKGELKSLRRQWDETLVHRLRIHTKRLRYLLEPLAAEPRTAMAVAALKRLQEELGDYRDLQLLRQHLATQYPDNSAVAALITSLQAPLQQQRRRAERYQRRRGRDKLLKPLRAALRRRAR
ncbi:MAG: CHAD domain-containing protein [Gammaproteobacteria bacterium]|nr:CHAD domain-containing protein [Gammaproteobacteria bacterium]